VGIGSGNREILTLTKFKERNMGLAEKLICGLVKIHGRYLTESSDGGEA
jgi:hypothetical protein